MEILETQLNRSIRPIQQRGSSGHQGKHRRRTRMDVIELLMHPHLSHVEIAAATDLSRERVRQIAAYFGFPARRAMPHRAPEIKGARNIRAEEMYRAFEEAAAKNGIEVEPGNIPRGGSVTAKVTGAEIRLLRASLTNQGRYRFYAPVYRTPVAAFWLPDGRWLILPIEEMPNRETEFSPFPIHRGPFKSYVPFIEAWHLLKALEGRPK